MTHKQPTKTNKSKKDQVKKLPQLQQLELSQLDGVAGGIFANPFA